MGIIFRLFSFFAIMLPASHAIGATHVSPLSQYGQIQNVQNYSSNPFWNPNGPYNQTFPRPVYVDGPDLNSGDCERTVYALIASYCATNGNCVGMQLSDVRPSIMLQLSRLPGHNWATQCMGYIDSAFSQYQSTAQNHVPTTLVSFPTGGTVANPDIKSNEFKIKNPFAPQIPDWAKEMQERKQELKDLHSQTSNYDNSLAYAKYPSTYEDLSFAEQIQIQTDGYLPYKDKSPYHPITIEKPQTNSQTAKGVKAVAPQEKTVTEVNEPEQPEQPEQQEVVQNKVEFEKNVGTVAAGRPASIDSNMADGAGGKDNNVSYSYSLIPTLSIGDESLQITDGVGRKVKICPDCSEMIARFLDDYYKKKPWGTVSENICTPMPLNTEKLGADVLNIIKTENVCNVCDKVKGDFLSFYANTNFCSKISVSYDKSTDYAKIDIGLCQQIPVPEY